MIENRRMSQAEFMYHYNNQNREQFNEKLFDRDMDDIINSVKNIIMSCERDKYFTLEVVSMNTITDYEEIYNKLREHEENRKKKGKDKDNNYDYLQMKDSDIVLLEVIYHVRINGIERMKIDNKDVDVDHPEQLLPVLIAIPRFVDKYYFRLSGNYYAPIFQLVDGSTYNNSTTNNSKCDSVTLKTLLMSVRLFRTFRDMVDENTREVVSSILFTSIIFSSHLDVMFYILGKYGLYATMDILRINCISITDYPITDSNYYCFKKCNLYISVPKSMYAIHTIQSLVVTIYDGINKDTTLLEVYDTNYWLKVLGGCFKNASIDKGISTLDSLEDIYDLNTKASLRIPEEEKQNIYQILIWMITNFSALRSKDNLDISIKKFRIGEYIAHAYGMKLSKGLHRISDAGKKVKMRQVLGAVYTPPMALISATIGMSNLVAYVDQINDNDATVALKCTYKGISGLGEDGAPVQEVYKFIDPSSMGILDPDTSSNSDPGMTGMICPMTDVYGDSFSDYKEEFNWYNQIDEVNASYNKEHNLQSALSMPTNNITDYDYIKKDIVKANINVGRKVCPIIDLDGIADYKTNDGINKIIPKNVKMNSLFSVIEECNDTSHLILNDEDYDDDY